MKASNIKQLCQSIPSSVILFPGQGSQYVGMVNNLTDKGRHLFQLANQVLSYDLLSLCTSGPEDDLNRTIHSQPAVFVSSLSAVERLASMSRNAVENCIATAGFSVGEFAALVFAQSIDFLDALRFLKIRAEASQEVSSSVPSGMMSVFFGNDGRVGEACRLAREFCERSEMSKGESVCSISNHLSPHIKIIGGHQTALNFIETNKANFGIKRCKRLAVSGAFHTTLMRETHKILVRELDKIKINEPRIKVYSNIDGKPYTDANQVRLKLAQHIWKPVMWEQTMHAIYDKPENIDLVTFECGPQNQLITLLGMTNKKARLQAYNIEP